MDGEVLVLNSDYEPLNVCNVRRAIALVHLGKAEILHTDNRIIRLHNGELVSPSVLKLRHHVRRPIPQLRLSRRSVFARDDYQCQYCGVSGREPRRPRFVPYIRLAKYVAGQKNEVWRTYLPPMPGNVLES
jgi:5-methylcytosine-specific restriction endonuclease McrA